MDYESIEQKYISNISALGVSGEDSLDIVRYAQALAAFHKELERGSVIMLDSGECVYQVSFMQVSSLNVEEFVDKLLQGIFERYENLSYYIQRDTRLPSLYVYRKKDLEAIGAGASIQQNISKIGVAAYEGMIFKK